MIEFDVEPRNGIEFGVERRESPIYGHSPYIGENGTWMVYDNINGWHDTGIVANGRDGRDGVDGQDGYTPQKGIDYFDGRDGQDYILTDDDKEKIAQIAAELVPTYDDSEIRGELSSLTDRVDNIDEVIIETVEPLQKQADDTERSVDALWKLSKGQLWDIESVECEGHAQLPCGGEYGNVDEIRGKTEQDSTNGHQLFDGVRSLSVTAKYGPMFALPPHTCKAGVTYTVSFDTPKLSGYEVYCQSRPSDSNISYARFTLDGTRKSFTFTPTADCTLGNPCISRYTDTDDTHISLSNLMLETGSTAHPYEAYTGGIPSPNPDYPQEIVSVESIHILHTDAEGATLNERTIIPPRPLNAIGEYKDKLNVVGGEWEYALKEITEADYVHSVVREPEYFLLSEPQSEPIDPADLEWMRNLTLLPGENLFITDNHGRDVSYLMSDFINLGKVGG